MKDTAEHNHALASAPIFREGLYKCIIIHLHVYMYTCTGVYNPIYTTCGCGPADIIHVHVHVHVPCIHLLARVMCILGHSNCAPFSPFGTQE